MPALPPPPSLDTEQDVEQMCALFGLKPEDFIAELNYRLQRKFQNAMRIQRLAAKVQGERKIIRAGSDGGEVTQQLHPVLYHSLRRRFGAEAMNDPGFLRELHREHPETVVKSRSEKTVVTVGRSVRGRRGRWAL